MPKSSKIPGLLLLLCISLSSCQSSSSRPVSSANEAASFPEFKDARVEDLLQKATDAAGGVANWNRWSSLSFEKHTILYDATGAVERDTRQYIHWRRNPSLVLSITWLEDEISHKIQFENEN